MTRSKKDIEPVTLTLALAGVVLGAVAAVGAAVYEMATDALKKK
jgi:hypothetical protein